MSPAVQAERQLDARQVADVLGLKPTKKGRPPTRLNSIVQAMGGSPPTYVGTTPRSNPKRVWDEEEIVALVIDRTTRVHPLADRFASGRSLATELRREKRDLAFYAKRIVFELGADELARILAPLHTGPLKHVRRGHGACLRIAMKSALRHAGKDAP